MAEVHPDDRQYPSDIGQTAQAIVNTRKIHKLLQTTAGMSIGCLDSETPAKFSLIKDTIELITKNEVKALRAKIATLPAMEQTEIMESLILGYIPAF